MIEIKRWDTNEVIHGGDFDSVKDCLEDGVKKGINFYRASLDYARLNHASLDYTILDHASLDHARLDGAKYSIIQIFKINFSALSDEMTLELMRHDAEFCGEDRMSDWAKGGACPYNGMCQDFYFNEKKELWQPGAPKLRGLELWRALAKEKNIKISV
jgi:hypothetical protein